jgi:hypothetical protein
MKIFTTLAIITVSITSIAQTGIISRRSHSGNMVNINAEPDNFGGIVEDFFFLGKNNVDTVILDGECLIEIGRPMLILDEVQQQTFDTVCNDESLRQYGYSIEAVRSNYRPNVVFIGFEEEKDEPVDTSQPKDGGGSYWSNGGPFHNGTSGFLGLIFLSLLAYTITPILKKK